MENDSVTQQELNRLRGLLVQNHQMTPGLVPRLEAAVRRDRSARGTIGWEARLGVACMCFVVLGLWSGQTLSMPLAVVMGMLALTYPWILHAQRRELPWLRVHQ